jgi:hypothetical protein
LDTLFQTLEKEVLKWQKETVAGKTFTAACTAANDPLPYPLKNKSIDIHMASGLSSELILGTDFLSTHGAIMHLTTNKVIFLPEEFTSVGLSQKPIVAKAMASLVETNAPERDPCTYAVQPMEDQEILHMDQKTFHVQIITDNLSLIFKLGATVMLTSGFAPHPQIHDSLYLVGENNTVQDTVKNSFVKI